MNAVPKDRTYEPQGKPQTPLPIGTTITVHAGIHRGLHGVVSGYEHVSGKQFVSVLDAHGYTMWVLRENLRETTEP